MVGQSAYANELVCLASGEKRYQPIPDTRAFPVGNEPLSSPLQSSFVRTFLTGFPAYSLSLKTDFIPFKKSRKRQGLQLLQDPSRPNHACTGSVKKSSGFQGSFFQSPFAGNSQQYSNFKTLLKRISSRGYIESYQQIQQLWKLIYRHNQQLASRQVKAYSGQERSIQ